MLTLKDSIGTVGARFHHKALAEREFGRSICVGAVLVLQKFWSLCCGVFSLAFCVLSQCDIEQHCQEESSLGMPQEKVLPSEISTRRILSNLIQDPKSIRSGCNS